MAQSSGADYSKLTSFESASNQVVAVLASLGAPDGEYLFHVVQTLLQAPRAHSYANVVLSTAKAVAGGISEQVVQFAAAVEITAVAAIAHRRIAGAGETVLDAGPAIDGHLVVLAGDYLYAQAAYITATLQNLSVMASLAAAIKQQCVQEMAEASSVADAVNGGIYVLCAVGTGQLLRVDDELLSQLTYYGAQLDEDAASVASPHNQLTNGNSHRTQDQAARYVQSLEGLVSAVRDYRANQSLRPRMAR